MSILAIDNKCGKLRKNKEVLQTLSLTRDNAYELLHVVHARRIIWDYICDDT